MFAGKNYLVHTLELNGEMEILDHAQVNTNMILFRCVIMSVVMETIQIQFDQLPYTADATYNRLNELKEENPNLAGKIEDIKDNIFE